MLISGNPAWGPRNCREEAVKIVWTRDGGIQERDDSDFEVTTQKSGKIAWILH